MSENQPGKPGEADNLREILEDAAMMIKNNTGILTRLFRMLLRDLAMTEMRWGRLMDAYVKDPRAKVPDEPGYDSSEKTNLRKRLNSNNMTWKSLLKGLDFLQCKKSIFTVKVDDRGSGSCEFTQFKGKVNGLFELYGELLDALGIDVPTWDKLMDEYLLDPRNNITQTKKDRGSSRSKIVEILFRSQKITWPSFQKGIQIIKPKKVIYSLEVYINGHGYYVEQTYNQQPIRLNLNSLTKK